MAKMGRVDGGELPKSHNLGVNLSNLEDFGREMAELATQLWRFTGNFMPPANRRSRNRIAPSGKNSLKTLGLRLQGAP
jgi:hypothetical protein